MAIAIVLACWACWAGVAIYMINGAREQTARLPIHFVRGPPTSAPACDEQALRRLRQWLLGR